MRASTALHLGFRPRRAAGWHTEPGVEKTGLSIRLRAALGCRSLDRQLAEGVDPASSPLLQYRAERLTGDAERARIVCSLWGAMSASRTARGRSAAILPDLKEVARANHLLITAEALLGSQEPVYAQGVARLRRLLTDAAGSLFSPQYPGALADEFEKILAALRGRPAR